MYLEEWQELVFSRLKRKLKYQDIQLKPNRGLIFRPQLDNE
jgi:hypothetical protein